VVGVGGSGVVVVLSLAGVTGLTDDDEEVAEHAATPRAMTQEAATVALRIMAGTLHRPASRRPPPNGGSAGHPSAEP
jgi:hypothetical protein